MPHIQENFEGTHMQKWELDHKIVRMVHSGCEYVVCLDLDGFNAACEKEVRERKERERLEGKTDVWEVLGVVT